jgi:hypothetical protein
MAGWFRRSKQLPETHVDPDELKALLPASVRHPEANRFTPLGSDFDGEEGSDEDLEFLTTLVESVEHERAMPTRPAPPPASKAPIQRIVAESNALTDVDHMEIFREMRGDETEQRSVHIEVDEVELDDLLEDLSTTMAALRRRRAA